MTLAHLRAILRERGIRLWIEDGKLRYTAPKGALTPDLKSAIAEHKETLLTVFAAPSDPIVRAPRDAPLPLSFAQQRLWLLEQLDPGSPAYNIPAAVRLTGRLNVDALRRTFEEVVRRHESLRTTFSTVAGEPRQIIRPAAQWELPIVSLEGAPPPDRDEEVRRFAAEESRRPFSLEHGPLLRTTLLRLHGGEHILLLTMHHIVSDGWSEGVLIEELAALYPAFCDGRPSPLASLPIQYADFAAWQRGASQESVHDRQLDYWQRTLRGGAPMELATDRPRPQVQTSRGALATRLVSPQLADALRRLSQQHDATLFMTLLAAFDVLLSRYSGQKDVRVGTPIANRTLKETEGLIGFFVNTLVIRADLSGEPTFLEVLARVKEASLGAYAHQDVPFERLVATLESQRDLSRNPLFQVLFVVQNTPGGALSLPELTLSPIDVPVGIAKFDLSLSVVEDAGGLSCGIEYNTDLFDGSTIERLLGHFETLLAGIVSSPEARIADLPMLSEAERHRLLVEWNPTRRPRSRAERIHSLFEHQVDRTPDDVAVCFADDAVTYADLDRRANRLARHLRQLGVGPEVLVGVCVERSVAMVVTLLAILKAGGAYVPLDPEYPPERLALVADDAALALLVTQSHLASRVARDRARKILLDADAPLIDAHSDQRLPPAGSDESCAYVIYTSGSTGVPKGVAITHRSAVVFLHWAHRTFSPDELQGVFAVTSICFDLSIFELFAPLTCGGALVLARDALDVAALHSRRPVTLLNTVPSAMREWLRLGVVPSTARTVNLAGEPLTRALAKQVYEVPTVARLCNLYGPTEDTTYSTIAEIDRHDDRTPAIGVPVDNTFAYVLDADLKLVPIGVIGELWLGGDGLARGYLARPELTAERFVPDPFHPEGGRMYRTGDLARWRSDGTLECLGRVDFQVKLRGFRIELGEIEARLAKHPGVREAAVIVREDTPGDKRLAAYYVAADDEALGADVLRDYLAATLPEHMVPAAYVRLDALPSTANGKLDRKALPDPAGKGYAVAQFEAPEGEVEAALAVIWSSVLRVERIGRNDNFFALGGHSLLATQVVSRIRAQWNAALPLRDFFEAPTLARLAARVRDDGGARDVIPRAARSGKLALSFAQQRLWFLDQLDPGSAAYSLPIALRVRGALDVDALRRAFEEIVRRHETLRTTFGSEGGEPFQIVHPATTWPLPVDDVSRLPGAEREAEVQRRANEEAARPFSLEHGPLFRTSLVRASATEHVLLTTMHHILSDGWSIAVLVDELRALYAAFTEGRPSPLADLAVQYADFAAWQRSSLRGDVLDREVAYWRERLEHASPLELPTDRPRPPVQAYRGQSRPFALSAELTRELRALGQKHDATLFMTLMAAFQVLLGRRAGQDDVCVGTPIANRTRSDVEGLIGFFVNTLVVRTNLSSAPRFVDVLGRVREAALGAYAHQEVPFERLVDELAAGRDQSRSPLFQVLFALQNTPSASSPFPGLVVEALRTDERVAKFDLTLSLAEGPSGLAGEVEYNTDLFDGSTIERLLGHFETLLAGIVSSPEARIADLPMLSEAERHRLLVEWNPTRRPRSRAELIHSLFERQVDRTPDDVAVCFGDDAVTYADLDRRANRLARHLRQLGVGPEVLVGVCVERSVAMVVTLLAILKAGGAYVPLDPEYPPERLALVADDAALALLVTQSHLASRVARDRARKILLDADAPLIDAHSDQRLPPAGSDESCAYVIYTSGSTGVPKGVAITHRSAVVFLHWAHRTFSPDELQGVFAVTSICFDLSIFELFAPLTCGGALVLARDALDVAALHSRRPVTLLNTVPSAMREWLRLGVVPSTARTVNLAGEPLTRALAKQVYEVPTVARLCNLYGPTEDTTYSTIAEIDRHDDRTPAIGVPVDNTFAYVLDADLKLVPIGVIGELWLGGDGLARGYLARPELTAERFVPDPFHPEGGRMYRTGDLARWRSDGTLECLGRVDFQVKLRGFRIELGEIEAQLAKHPGVRTCAVIVREDVPGDRRLVAYVEAAATRPTSHDLREHAASCLPEFMIPSAFVHLDALPMTPNGKVDRKALPAPEMDRNVGAHYVAPRTPEEAAIAEIWRELLRVDRVGVHDDFFALGGHSLLATQVVSRIRSVLGVKAPLRALFESPTIASLSARVAGEAASARPASAMTAIAPARKDDRALLSFAQRRLWFLDQLEPGCAAYHISAALRVTGDLDVEALRRALEEIVRRHESLRTTFTATTDGGEPLQTVTAATTWSLPIDDASAVPEAEREAALKRRATEEAQRPFSLAEGPLLRTSLVRFSPRDHVLLFTMHHIVSDGWSMGVLAGEMSALYDAFARGGESPLAPLAIHYADFAAWQRSWLAGGELSRQLAYWKRQLAGTHALDLPTDRPRPVERGPRGATHAFAIDASRLASIKEVTRRAGATLFMTTLAAFKVLLARYARQDDIAIGTPIANRTQTEVEPLVGCFVNTLVLRSDLSGDPSFHEVLARVKAASLDAYAHQDAPFEKVVEEVAGTRSLSRTPLFQVMFAVQNAPAEPTSLTGLTVTAVDLADATAQFDLALDITETRDGGLLGEITYSTDLFDLETIARMSEHYRALLDAAVATPDAPVAGLPMMSDAERRRVLVEWNETAAPFPADARVHELFEAQARRTPGAVAIESGGSRWTYEELDARADALAARLRAAGVDEGTRVALSIERSPEMLMGLFGILKAGAAYVPIDPKLPRDRREWMLADARVGCIVVQGPAPAWLDPSVAVVDVAEMDRLVERATRTPLKRAPAESAAYVLYTSGSTGRPKGVLVSHRNLVNHATAMIRRFALTPSDRVLQFATISFDAAAEEIFPTLATGATLVLRGDDDLSHAAIERLGVTVLDLPTAFWHVWIDEMREGGARVPPSVRLVIVGGEAALRDRWDVWVALGGDRVRWINTYGPTEATISATAFDVAPGAALDRASIPIGRPIENVVTYVLDARREPLPIGVAGELWIGGEGVALGYFDRPELTAERFVSSPFGAGRLYRTGDLVRWSPDGVLEFLGRVDSQVKIRGYRVEVGEIEVVVRQLDAVRDAVVVARDAGIDRRLAAYVAPRAMPGTSDARAAFVAEVRAHLQSKLPAYMIPADVVLLEALPMTASQKVDRGALPTPDRADGEPSIAMVRPRDVWELRLTAIWEELLGRAPIGVRDGFFDLGGHSLLAVRLMARVRRELGRDLPLATLFVDGTIERMAKRLRDTDTQRDASPLVAIQPQGAEAPVFCVHPAGGNVLCFAELARALGRDRPLYGLQSVGLAGDASPDTTIDQMASRYVAAIREIRPRGPYHLVGYSVGGAIAYAMAARLRADGEVVATLTLLDAWSPSLLAKEQGESALVDFAREHGLGMDESELRALGPEAGLARVLDRALDARVVPADVDLPTLRRLIAVMASNVDAACAYRPTRCAMKNVTLIRAGGSAEEGDDSLGWRDVIDGQIAVRRVGGDHATMLASPIVAAIATILGEALSSSERPLARRSDHALEGHLK